MAARARPRSGLALIGEERRRQHADALASFATATLPAARIADSIGRTGRLVLLGMGGSHCVNRAAEPVYRACGIDATALVLSEVLDGPLPDRPRTVLVTSQSGRSGEVLRYLERRAGAEERFGLTLDADGPLAQAIPCLVGAGGAEIAFAATRSLLVSLALHGAVAAALGMPADGLLQSLRDPAPGDPAPAVAALAKVKAVVFSGRGALQGIAESGALCLMELARLPAMALEGGQLRHGPVEMLQPGIGVILLREAGAAASLAPALAALCRDAGTTPVLFDASGAAPLADCITLPFPAQTGLGAACTVLPPLQELLIELARRRVARVGEPLRARKVTVEP